MMDRKNSVRFGILALTALLAAGIAGQQKPKPALPPTYQNWLNNEVAYIITAKERDVFLALQTDKERDIFIDAFWKQRDPTPGTPENEFKQEHYRRIAYANQYYGRETTRPGWQTDRGRMSILLGPPLDTVSIQGGGTVHPCLIWSYETKSLYGLPAHFNLVFYKKDGFGEYILYSPAQDGPARLLVNYRGNFTNREEAYLRLRKYDSRLAEASLSMIPDDSTFTGQVSLASEQLLSRINSLPEKMVNSTYAEALLKFKDMVDVEYSANYIDSEAMLKVFQDESGLFFIHYAIEPKRLSVLTGEDSYSLNFVLNGIVTDPQNRVVFQYEKNIPLDFGKDQIEAIGKTSLAVQDMVPLIEGDYRFSLLLKNTASKEFTSFEGRISIPPDVEAALRMGPLLLGYQRKPVAAAAGFNKPFKIGRDQIACQPENIFHPKETLTVAFQLFGLKPDLARTAHVRYTVLKDGREVATKTKDLKDADRLNILEDLPLGGLPPGNYRLKVAVVDGGRKELLAAQENFGVSPLAALPRPWIVSKVMPSSSDLEYQYILGTQWMNINRLEDAERRLGTAARGNPASLKYALGHAQVLLKMKDYLKVKEVLRPFMEKPEASDRLLSLMGAACQALGDYEEAISAYTKYLAQAGTSLPVLNSLGDCYYRQGNLKEALAAWERSLEINPKQDSIQKLVDEIKRKK
ncbi:MAG: GWxTD domain-containing protein [Candidatus Aminicenantes bacterium]|nr:GWxTD domain-containing protein [Candidatus Aminicenantes bacterium]